MIEELTQTEAAMRNHLQTSSHVEGNPFCRTPTDSAARSLKIVMLCDFYDDTLEFQENLLAKYYTKHNHKVVIITSTFTSVFDYYHDRHDNSVPSQEYTLGGVKIIRLRYVFNILNRLRRYSSIRPILERESPDLIYIHDIMLNMLEAVRYKKRHRQCKMIMDYHADASNSGKNWLSLKVLHGIIRKLYLDRARPHLSKIFPVVPASTEFLHQIYKVPYEEMEVLPLGADTDFGREVKARGEGRTIREKFGIAPHETVIFTGGKLTPRRQTELLIQAFGEISVATLHLFVIGESSAEDRWYKELLVEKAKSCPRIHFVGWLHSRDVYKYLDASDLAVFPAAQSILWQTSISMGLPLIVGDIGNQDISYLNKYRNIIILRKHEISSARLKEEIVSLLSDRERLERMKLGAAQATEEFLNWNHLISRTLKFNTEDESGIANPVGWSSDPVEISGH